jgi:hypothetical protein
MTQSCGVFPARTNRHKIIGDPMQHVSRLDVVLVLAKLCPAKTVNRDMCRKLHVGVPVHFPEPIDVRIERSHTAVREAHHRDPMWID